MLVGPVACGNKSVESRGIGVGSPVSVNRNEHLEMSANWVLYFALLKESVYVAYVLFSANQFVVLAGKFMCNLTT